MKGDLGRTRDREGGEEAAGRAGPVLTASTSLTPEVLIPILRAWKGVEGDMCSDLLLEVTLVKVWRQSEGLD